MIFHFEQGRSYYVGIDKPALISMDTLIGAVEDEGFEVLGVYPCEDYPGMPFPVPGSCGDEWDWVGLVRRIAPSGPYDAPDRVKWVQMIPDAPPAPVPPPPGESPVGPDPYVPVDPPPTPPVPDAPAAPAIPERKSALSLGRVALIGAGLLGGYLGARWGFQR